MVLRFAPFTIVVFRAILLSPQADTDPVLPDKALFTLDHKVPHVFL